MQTQDKPKGKRVREKFTEEEDNHLRELVGKYGHNWPVIADNMKTKNIRQCKERWSMYLAPGRNDEPFSAIEIYKLIDLVQKFGHKWHVISTCFNRTEVQIKNIWKVLQRKNTFFNQNLIPNKISKKCAHKTKCTSNETVQHPSMIESMPSIDNFIEVATKSHQTNKFVLPNIQILNPKDTIDVISKKVTLPPCPPLILFD